MEAVRKRKDHNLFSTFKNLVYLQRKQEKIFADLEAKKKVAQRQYQAIQDKWSK